MSPEIEIVKIPSEGLSCAGTLFRPRTQGAGARLPAVLLTHGFAAVRGMRNLPEVAAALTEAGMAALTLDYRFLGESEGEPRQTVSPFRQRQDIRNGLSWLAARGDVDAARLGLWGTSFSGGQVLQVAAFDRRVKAVVAQVPATDLFRQIRSAPASYRTMIDTLIADDRARRLQGMASEHVRLAAPEGEVSLFGEDSLDWILRNAREHATLENGVTIVSLEEVIEFDPGNYIEAISPTPVLMIMADQDKTVSPTLTRQAFERAGEPKRLLIVKGSHYAVYDEAEIVAQAAEAARDWFLAHL